MYIEVKGDVTNENTLIEYNDSYSGYIPFFIESVDKEFISSYKVRYLINHDEIISIGYTKNKDIKVGECEIMFLKKAHVFSVNVWLSIQELQAINEKCKELGWLDE